MLGAGANLKQGQPPEANPCSDPQPLEPDEEQEREAVAKHCNRRRPVWGKFVEEALVYRLWFEAKGMQLLCHSLQSQGMLCIQANSTDHTTDAFIFTFKSTFLINTY